MSAVERVTAAYADSDARLAEIAETAAMRGAADITRFGGWRAWTGCGAAV
jgi:hypothetical protein